MIGIIRRIIHLGGKKNGIRVKLGFLFGFLEAVFSAFSIIAVFLALNEASRVQQAGVSFDTDVIVVCSLILLAGVIGKTLSRYFLSVFQSGTGYDIFAAQRLEIGDMLKRVPLGYFDQHNVGDVTAAITTDMSFVEMYCMFLLDKVVNGYTTAVLYSLVILCFDWRIGLIYIGAILVAGIVYHVLQLRGRALAPRRQGAQASLVTAVLEYIQGMSVVKAFHMTEDSCSRVHDAFRESCASNFKMEKELVPLSSLYDFIFKIAICLVLFVASYFAIGQTMSLPVLLMLLVASFTLFGTLENMGGITVQLRMMDASLDRVEAIKDIDVIDEGAKDLELNKFDVELQNVSFSYDNREVIHDVSFKVPEGSMTAIVGPSGSGKTTICNLISRFWDVNKGTVKIGGVNIKEMTCDSLLKNISMVFQKVYLFHDTIYNNILFGNPNASREDVESAAKKACCHDFIMQLPEGYDTLIGEGGSTLSGGEKQRISIARAILKNAPIIILDEATASIDPENERDIQKALSELTRNKTKIVIAHRLATIQDADQIIVLDQGRIAQMGNHKQLICQEGIYKNFYNIRSKVSEWNITH